MPTAALPNQGNRWRIPPILAITLFVNYLDRNNLSLALPRIAEDFGWTDREVGANGEVLLAAFFLSYAISNMLLSPLAERIGPKRSVILAIAAFSVFTILSAPFGQSLTALIVLRLLLGLGEGVHIPMLSAITSRWFPPSERSRANAIWASGILFATTAAPLLIVPLINAIGWRPTFAVLGVVGMVISIPLVWLFIQDDPKSPTLELHGDEASSSETSSELFSETSSETSSEISSSAIANPLQRTYLRDARFWLAVLGGTLNAFCAFGILNWLPTYFNRDKGINFESLGLPLASIFAAGIVGIILMAYLGDKLQQRALLAGAGFFVGGGMVYVASRVDAVGLLVLFFALAVFCQSAYAAQEYAIVQRLLPVDRVGAGTGLYNGLSVLFGGVGGSLIPGSIVAATGSFDAGILSIVVGAWLAALVMVGLARTIGY